VCQQCCWHGTSEGCCCWATSGNQATPAQHQSHGRWLGLKLNARQWQGWRARVCCVRISAAECSCNRQTWTEFWNWIDEAFIVVPPFLCASLSDPLLCYLSIPKSFYLTKWYKWQAPIGQIYREECKRKYTMSTLLIQMPSFPLLLGPIGLSSNTVLSLMQHRAN
jgi:hypothetical protein